MNEQYRLNGELVRKYLRDGDRKQSHLVKELDVSGSLVAQMLGGHVPQEETLQKLAELMGVQVSDLLIPKKARETA